MLSNVIDRVTSGVDGTIVPRALSDYMHLEIQALSRMSHVNRNTLTSNPTSPKVQEALTPVVKILTIAAELTNSQGKAIAWFLHQPLSDFDFKTPQELVTEGHAEAVKSHLRMLADGIYG